MRFHCLPLTQLRPPARLHACSVCTLGTSRSQAAALTFERVFVKWPVHQSTAVAFLALMDEVWWDKGPGFPHRYTHNRTVSLTDVSFPMIIKGLWVIFHKGLDCGVYISLLRMYLFTHERKQEDNNIPLAHPGAGITAP